MSEKRFSVDDDGIYDTQEKKHFKFIAYDWIDCDIYECCEKLNEQQSTINKQDKEIAELDQECADILGARIKAQEEWEKCTDKLKTKILKQQTIIGQLRTQLMICQQSKNDNGGFQVWQVPPIRKSMRVSTTTIDDEQKKDSKRWRWSE